MGLVGGCNQVLTVSLPRSLVNGAANLSELERQVQKLDDSVARIDVSSRGCDSPGAPNGYSEPQLIAASFCRRCDYVLTVVIGCLAEWASYLPSVIAPGKSRLLLFNRQERREIKKSRKMKALPDLSVIVENEMDPPRNNLMMMLDGMGLDGTSGVNPHTEPPLNFAPEENVDPSLETTVPLPREANKKRSRDDVFVTTVSGDAPEAVDRLQTGECPKKKKKKKPAAEFSEPCEGNETHEVDHVGEPVDEPVVSQIQILRLFETPLRRNTSIARAKEDLNGAIEARDRAVIQKKAIKKKSGHLEAELKVAREESEELRPKNAELEREKTEIASNHARELI
ncbi:hypothetical protein DY000_02014242 [Brassica cretica]|uniref:Uncharacterized protein n=1 Tax=Brassica cretica TaxID=69181 RepID=A0ABQ7DA93_BRACR|nr:hypothetical protein DY000_02014242 [Brassica cretica]